MEIVFRKENVWSQRADHCVQCKTTEQPHCSHGYCKTCYYRIYREARKSQKTKSKS